MGLPGVQPIEHLVDLSSFWLAGTLTTIPSPGQLSWRYCNLVGFGGIHLVRHPPELSKQEKSQTPLDVKPANRDAR